MVIIANTIGSLKQRQEKSSCKEMIRQCGENTGNVVFVDSVFEQFRYDAEVQWSLIDMKQDDNIYVIPASNWINRNAKVLQTLFLRLRDSKVRVIVLGIGIQMNLGESVTQFIDDLSGDTVLALKIMSEHSIEIGVRGEITGEVLDRLGIHNWKVIGCPSFYEPFRKYGKSELKEASDKNVLVNIQGRKRNSYKMMELGMNADADILLQTMDDLPLTIEGGDIRKDHLDTRYPNGNFNVDQLENYYKQYGKIFYDGYSWEKYLIEKKYTFATGYRFHGNMKSFITGIPTLWIMHDVRTKELIEALKLPHIFHEELEDIDSISDLLSLCQYNAEFQKRYKKMGKEYVMFLEANGILEHNFNKYADC